MTDETCVWYFLSNNVYQLVFPSGSSTSIEMSPIQRNGFGVEDSNLIDSAHHINIMKKISELQLTVDSLQNKKNKTEENSQKVKEYPENDEVNFVAFSILWKSICFFFR